MDSSRFDGFVRTLATGQTRRQAILSLAGSAFAALLGQAGIDEAAAACVKPGKKGCKGPKNKQCCAGAVCKGGTKEKEGRCKCKGGTKQCGTKCVNTKTDRKHCGTCNNACQDNLTCRSGKCLGPGSCLADQPYCEVPGGEETPCPDKPGCLCVTDVKGGAHCSDISAGACSTCTSNDQCPDGQVCIPGGEFCCPGATACISATCATAASGARGSTSLK